MQSTAPSRACRARWSSRRASRCAWRRAQARGAADTSSSSSSSCGRHVLLACACSICMPLQQQPLMSPPRLQQLQMPRSSCGCRARNATARHRLARPITPALRPFPTPSHLHRSRCMQRSLRCGLATAPSGAARCWRWTATEQSCRCGRPERTWRRARQLQWRRCDAASGMPQSACGGGADQLGCGAAAAAAVMARCLKARPALTTARRRSSSPET